MGTQNNNVNDLRPLETTVLDHGRHPGSNRTREQ